MLSARLAECALRDMYLRDGRQVVDVSAAQLESSSAEWWLYDLGVDGVRLDVKNARRGFDFEGGYVDWCVTDFKRARTVGDIEIAGVLSPYLRWNEMLASGQIARFMGKAAGRRIHELELSWPKDIITLGDASSLVAAKFLPPWVFDFDQSWYHERDAALKELTSATPSSRALPRDLGAQVAVLWTAAAVECPPGCRSRANASYRQLLQARVRDHGLHLDTVYLATLEYCLGLVKDSRVDAFDAAAVRDALFAGPGRTRPLLVADVTREVDALLTSLSALIAEKEIREFRIFGISGPGIVRGKRCMGEAKWTTLLAYCGGWIGHERKCMKNPLILGRQLPCGCGHLVCDQCGYCDPRCPECGPRQAKRLEERHAHRKDGAPPRDATRDQP
jgi:hypothetical protein